MPKIKRSKLPRRISNRRIFIYDAVIPERRKLSERRSNLIDRRIHYHGESYTGFEESVQV